MPSQDREAGRASVRGGLRRLKAMKIVKTVQEDRAAVGKCWLEQEVQLIGAIKS